MGPFLQVLRFDWPALFPIKWVAQNMLRFKRLAVSNMPVAHRVYQILKNSGMACAHSSLVKRVPAAERMVFSQAQTGDSKDTLTDQVTK